jgi:murein DD-endopeptidase MepM/ murein hydrolase activator NlpD
MHWFSAHPSLEKKKKLKPGWLVLISLLVAINIYCFVIRGLPSVEFEPKTAPGNSSFQQEPPPPSSRFASPLGEMRGVAGVRSMQGDQNSPGIHRSRLRFDFEEAVGISGQRTLDQWCEKIEGKILRGETLSVSLQRNGIGRSQQIEIFATLKNVLDFKHCHEGETFTVWMAPTGNFVRFVFRQSPLLSFLAERKEKRLIGRRVEERFDVELVPLAIRIEDSLYLSIERAHETSSLAMLIADIFAWDIDFYVDTRRGDVIRLMLEKNKLNGAFVGYGRILAAEYLGEVVQRKAFHYQTKSGDPGYYDEQGGSIRKAFLKSPLKFVHITSSYGMRVHPILGYSGMHNGVDFGAPIGTPIWAPADGNVRTAGYLGANGNLIVLHHVNGYETLYAHLSSIAHGVRVGQRVRQKQVIGYVGSTGLSTGPHLHYAMKRNGQYINPLKQKFPPADPVPKTEINDYRATIAPILERLSAIPVPPFAQTASIRNRTEGAG